MNKDIANLPNSITLIRLILIPFIMFFAYIETTTGNIMATIFFFVACLTDYFDGIIARQLNSVSDFGKVADQIVDKILVASILIVLVEIERVQGWIVIILIAREFAVSGMRNYLSYKGVIVPAFYSGKLKTATQMVAIFLLLFYESLLGINFYIIGTYLIYLALFFSVYSLFEYYYRLFRKL